MSEIDSIDETMIELAADVVAAFVSNNSVSVSDLPALIASVHGAIPRLGKPPAAVVEETQKPAVAPKKSVTPDYIICLEDGAKFKSLKRHLRTKYGMTPEDHRAKRGLPADYPMVAPAYAAARSDLAKKMGLGQQRAKAVPAAPKVTRGRPRKVAVRHSSLWAAERRGRSLIQLRDIGQKWRVADPGRETIELAAVQLEGLKSPCIAVAGRRLHGSL